MIDDATVIRKMAERDPAAHLWVIRKHGLYYRPNAHGYTSHISEAWMLPEDEARKHIYPYAPDPVTMLKPPLPPYLTSRDALAPILEGLSEDEWDRLAINVLPRIYHEKHPLRPVSISRFLLTLPPRDLAYAIAEVLTPTIRPTPENTLQKNP
jgi:hypothetical protein